jgi:hypothetical protein
MILFFGRKTLKRRQAFCTAKTAFSAMKIKTEFI